MKEATGELNMTVVVVLIVALLSFFFFRFLWPNIKSGFHQEQNCDQAICPCASEVENYNLKEYSEATIECCVKGDSSKRITCPWKG